LVLLILVGVLEVVDKARDERLLLVKVAFIAVRWLVLLVLDERSQQVQQLVRLLGLAEQN